METQMEIINNFCDKFDINQEGKDELIEIFKNSFVHIAMGIMNMPGVEKTTKKTTRTKTNKKMCAAKTKAGNNCKKAAQEGMEYCKLHQPKDIDSDEVAPIDRDGKSCNGVMQNGNPCNNSRGKLTQPDGAKFYYCFRHTKNWRKFEGDNVSDSDSDNGSTGATAKVELTSEQQKEMDANGFTTPEEYLEATKVYDKIKGKLSGDDEKKFVEDNTIVSEPDSDNTSNPSDTDDTPQQEKAQPKKYRRPRVISKKLEAEKKKLQESD